jgi:hypothetical protein
MDAPLGTIIIYARDMKRTAAFYATHFGFETTGEGTGGEMGDTRCAFCGKEHDISDTEPSFRRPDAVISIPPEERGFRVIDDDHACAVRDLADTSRQYFLRVLMPFEVAGRSSPCSWGIWVEVSERDHEVTRALWDDPNQHLQPPFFGRLANRIWDYPSTLGLRGWVQLQSPTLIPTFLLEPSDHPLAVEQKDGVTEEKVLQWLQPILHPGSLVQRYLPPS